MLLCSCCCRQALKLLVDKPQLSSLKLDFIPFLTRAQLRAVNGSPDNNHTTTTTTTSSSSRLQTLNPTSNPTNSSSGATAAAGGGGGIGGAGGDKGGLGGSSGTLHGFTDGEGPHGERLPGEGYMALSHSRQGLGQRSGAVGVYLVPRGRYAARVNTVEAYGDVNREVSWGGGRRGEKGGGVLGVIALL